MCLQIWKKQRGEGIKRANIFRHQRKYREGNAKRYEDKLEGARMIEEKIQQVERIQTVSYALCASILSYCIPRGM
jgi:hypothetical protein